MQIFILNIKKGDWQNGGHSILTFAGLSKEQCLNKAFNSISAITLEELQEEDSDFSLRDNNFIELLNEHGDAWSRTYENIEWIMLEKSGSDVNVIPC